MNLSLTCKALYHLFHQEKLIEYFKKMENKKIHKDLNKTIEYFAYDRYAMPLQNSYFVRYINDVIFTEHRIFIAEKALKFFKDIKETIEEDVDFNEYDFLTESTEFVDIWEKRSADLINNATIKISDWLADALEDNLHAFDYHPEMIQSINLQELTSGELDWGTIPELEKSNDLNNKLR